ncbi:Rho GTPase activation protein [Entophlyctis helioformis]|nr:Rho GTPase activation protein [Entophlyctis helioformis]
MSKYEPSGLARAAYVAASNGLALGNNGSGGSSNYSSSYNSYGNPNGGTGGGPPSAGYAAYGGGPKSAAASEASGGRKGRDSRYSVAALWSMAAENDVEVDDELTKAQRKLREIKLKISSQSKRNFVLERDVRYLDSRIALLIQNRMALSEQQEVASRLEEVETGEGYIRDDRRRQLYANLFYLLQSEPRHVAGLARIVSLSEIDPLLQTVMFTLFGNQYETREEYLLLSMFQNVLAADFESATDFGSLMRANTPVSRMMTTYTRRGPGQSYLKNVLSERVNKLIELQDLDLEINPLKVYEQMVKDIEDTTGSSSGLPRSVTPDVATANADVQAIIAPRVKTLMEIGTLFLQTIMTSLEQVPYGIRWICKQIRSLTKRKYPQATEYQICSLIGGFFMLRFVNPAIVTPQAYMLIEATAQKNPRRTLTLLAKLLQNLANKPSYAKEPYMAVLAPFIDRHKPQFNKFLNDLCEVGDFSEALEMEQYIALSKKEIELNITLNEIHNTQGLLVQHMDILCPDEESHLRILLSELGQAPAQVPRADNKTVSLQLFSRWDQTTNINSPSAAGADKLTHGDFLYMDTKAIFVQILRIAPGLAAQRPVALVKVAEFACTSRDPTLVRKGLKVRDMLMELETLGLVQASDGHKHMVEEILQELTHLGNLKENVNTEITSLEAVYKTIQDHNDYLRSQLESYKAYLYNVRNQSGLSTKTTHKMVAPIKFTHQKLEQEGLIVESNIPENRRANIFFSISSPNPGAYLIALCFKGREKPILEMDLKLDDLLEKQQLGVETLDVEYVTLSVSRTITLLNKSFNKK